MLSLGINIARKVFFVQQKNVVSDNSIRSRKVGKDIVKCCCYYLVVVVVKETPTATEKGCP